MDILLTACGGSQQSQAEERGRIVFHMGPVRGRMSGTYGVTDIRVG